MFLVVTTVLFLFFCVWFLPYFFIDEYVSIHLVYDGNTISLDKESIDHMRRDDIHPWSDIRLEIQNDTDQSCPVKIQEVGRYDSLFTLDARKTNSSFGTKEKTTITVCGKTTTVDLSILK